MAAIALSLACAGARVGVRCLHDRAPAEAASTSRSTMPGSTARASPAPRVTRRTGRTSSTAICRARSPAGVRRSAHAAAAPRRDPAAHLGARVHPLGELERLHERDSARRDPTPIDADVWGQPDSLRDLDQKIATARPGEPDATGGVAAFLVSELASDITGTTLAVDGGMLMQLDFSHGD